MRNCLHAKVWTLSHRHHESVHPCQKPFAPVEPSLSINPRMLATAKAFRRFPRPGTTLLDDGSYQCVICESYRDIQPHYERCHSWREY